MHFCEVFQSESGLIKWFNIHIHMNRENLIPKTNLQFQYGVNKANQTIITENISLNQVKARPRRFPKLCSDTISATLFVSTLC